MGALFPLDMATALGQRPKVVASDSKANEIALIADFDAKVHHL